MSRPDTTATSASSGIDLAGVTAWMSAQVPQLTAPFAFELISGGRSNLTFRGEDAAGVGFVLRRPPLGHTLATAHDVAREARILSGLADSAVPVPMVYGVCEDPSVNAAPFYVMEMVDGAILRGPADVEAAFAESERASLADSLVSVLVDIHNTDPDEVGLGDLGKRAGYLDRQLRRWSRQYESVASRDVPLLSETHRRLVALRPEQQRDAIVHGDYRLDNVIFGSDARVAAVLDWELCTLGDPLADLGGLLISWVHSDEEGAHMLDRVPTRLPGFPRREELIARYAALTGLDVSAVDYYVAFAYWRLGCIGEGVYARYRDGKMGEVSDITPEQIAANVELLAELADAALNQL